MYADFGTSVLHPGSVAIAALDSDISIKGCSWNTISHGQGVTYPIPQARDGQAITIPLHPNDTICIGEFEMVVELCGIIDIESSPCNGVEQAGRTPPQVNGIDSIVDTEKLEHPVDNTSRRLSAEEVAVDETPTASYSRTETWSELVSTIAQNAMRGKDDSQTWGADPNLRMVLDTIRGEGRHSQPTPPLSTTPSPQAGILDAHQGISETPLKPSSPVDKHEHQGDLENSAGQEADHVEPAAAPDHSDNATTDSESVNDDTQTRTIAGADVLISAASSREDNPGLSELPNPSEVLTQTKADMEDTVESSVPHYLQRGSKRAKIGDSKTGESQDSMQGAIIVERHSEPPDAIPQNEPERSTTPHTVQTPLSIPHLEELPSMTRLPESLASSFKSSKSTARQDSSEPASSLRSTRSGDHQMSQGSPSPAANMRVVFASSTTVDKSKVYMKFLARNGVQRATSVANSDVLCVGKNTELRRTANLISAVALGKDIITDDWVSDCAKQGKILGLADYRAKDPEREAEWGTTLSAAIERSRRGVRPLSDCCICFTPGAKAQLGKGFAEIKEICLQAGAKSIQSSTPAGSPSDPPTSIVISTEGDKDLETLHANGWRTYSKDLLTFGILRGQLDLDHDEFLIKQNTGPTNPSTKNKKRTR